MLHQQVGALDQVDAHFVGEERVLVIGAVVDARGQQHHGRLAGAIGRRDRAQRRQQFIGVVRHRCDRGCAEQVGEQPQHHLAVLDHVGHAGWRAAIVLEHVVVVRAGAHHVDAGDMRIHLAGQVQPAISGRNSLLCRIRRSGMRPARMISRSW